MYKVFGEGDNIRYTQTKDGKTQYIFLFNFPENNVRITELSLAKNAKLQLLGSRKKLSFTKTSNAVEIKIPSEERHVSDYVWVIKVQQ
jgi:alpha-L-fucosidase